MEKITFIKRETTDQDGRTLIGRNARAYTRVTLKVASQGNRYISGFGSPENENWQIDDEVNISITESDKKDRNGLPYLNFTMPKKANPDMDRFASTLNNIQYQNGEILQLLSKIVGKVDALDELIRWKQEVNSQHIPLAKTPININGSSKDIIENNEPPF